MATFERLDYGSPDGSQWGGASTDAIGFYGATPVSRYATALQASTFLVTSVTTAASSVAGFQTAAHLSSFITQVSSVIRMLERYGLTSST